VIIPDAKDGNELGGDWLSLESPEFDRGWRRFCSNMICQSLERCRFIYKFALSHSHKAKATFRKRMDNHLANCCATWLWMQGKGNPDFTLADACDWLDVDSLAFREEFLALLGSPQDISKVDRWVHRRVLLTGCLWEEESNRSESTLLVPSAGKLDCKVRGSRHGRSKLTEEDVRKILALDLIGKDHVELAEMFGISRPQIGLICSGDRWAHVYREVRG